MCAPILKRKLALALLVSLAVLCGCAHQYLLVLSNGDRVISVSKPKTQGTSYHFTDSTGEEHLIPQSRVVKIKTVSVVKEEQEAKPSVQPKPKKPKHWYLLWLA
jgi:hypothetical protein